MKPTAPATAATSPARPLLAALGRITDLFAYPLRTSHYVELVNPLWTTHQLQARVVKVWDETRDARTLTLKPGLNYDYLSAPVAFDRVCVVASGKEIPIEDWSVRFTAALSG